MAEQGKIRRLLYDPSGEATSDDLMKSLEDLQNQLFQQDKQLTKAEGRSIRDRLVKMFATDEAGQKELRERIDNILLKDNYSDEFIDFIDDLSKKGKALKDMGDIDYVRGMGLLEESEVLNKRQIRSLSEILSNPKRFGFSDELGQIGTKTLLKGAGIGLGAVGASLLKPDIVDAMDIMYAGQDFAMQNPKSQEFFNKSQLGQAVMGQMQTNTAFRDWLLKFSRFGETPSRGGAKRTGLDKFRGEMEARGRVTYE